MAADSQKTIEILLQFKQAGQEILQQAQKAIDGLGPSAQGATASFAKLDADATNALSDAAEKVQKLSQALDEVPEPADHASSSLKELGAQLRSAFGRGSSLQLLLGGGAVVGLSILGSRLKELSGEVLDLKNQFDAGKISAGEFAQKVAETAPLLGEFYKFGENISELFTGAEAAEAKAEAGVTAFGKVVDQQTKALADLKKYAKQAGDELAQIGQGANRKDELLNAQGINKPLLQIDFDETDAKKKIQSLLDKVNEQIKEAETDNAARLAANVAGHPLGPSPDPDGSKYAALLATRKQLQKQAADATKAVDKESTDERTAIELDADQKIALGYVDAWLKAYNQVKAFTQKITDEDAKQRKEAALALAKEGDALTTSLQTPLEKYQASLKQLQQLKKAGDISGTTFDRGAQAQQVDLDKAQAAKVSASDQAQVEISAGIDKMIAQAKADYDRDLASFQEELDGKLITQQQHDTAVIGRAQQLQDDMDRIRRQAADQKVGAQDEFNVAVATGPQKVAAEAQQQYDRDVANWREALAQKQITQDQYDAFLDKAQADRIEKLHQFAAQQQQAQGQADLLILGSNHDTTGVANKQIDIDQDAAREQLQQQYNQGLLDETKYQAALVAVDQTYAQKRLAVNGTIFDGFRIGLQDSLDQMKTMSQMGQQIGTDFSSGVADAFTNIITGSKTAAQAFTQFAVSIIQDIVKMVVEFEVLSIFKAFLGGIGGGATAAPPGGVYTPGMNTGGIVGYASGGQVGSGAWGPNRDSVLAALTLGEFVINRSAAQQPGMLGLLSAINSGAASMPSPASRSALPAPAGVAGSTNSPNGLMPQVVPAVVANESTMRSLISGGRNSLLDFFRSNSTQINSALGRS